MIWRSLTVTAFGVTLSFGLAAFNNLYGAAVAFAVTCVFGVVAYLNTDDLDQDGETETTNRSRIDAGGSSGVVSMSEITEASICKKLDHPDVTVKKIDRDDDGVWFASVETSAGARDLDRIVGSEFDVEGKMGTMDGTTARLVPNLEEWERE